MGNEPGDPAGQGSLDDALVRARAGDEAGFLRLWRELHPRLLRYLRVLSRDDADDVASETWLQVVRDLHRFDGGEDDFRRWLFTIGRHRAVDAGRARARSRSRLVSADVSSVADQQVAGKHLTGNYLVENQVLDGMSTRQAVSLVAELSRDQAEAVALRIIAGLDTAAVARILGKSPGAVRIALHRGLRALAADPRLHALREVNR